MEEGTRIRRRIQAQGILESDTTPVEKVRKLVSLGYDEEDADTMVYAMQRGPVQPLYYEQLPGPAYADDNS